MTAAPGPATFTVDPWDPCYGPAYGDELDSGPLEESSAELNLDLEVPAHPVDPDSAPRLPGTVLFLDGVRRIDARIWVHGRGPSLPPASPRRSPPGWSVAKVQHASLMSLSNAACSPRRPRPPTSSPSPPAMLPGWQANPGIDQLSLALHGRLACAEVQLAPTVRSKHWAGDDLLIVDGPLRGHTHLDRTVGYIKAHHASYQAPGRYPGTNLVLRYEVKPHPGIA